MKLFWLLFWQTQISNMWQSKSQWEEKDLKHQNLTSTSPKIKERAKKKREVQKSDSRGERVREAFTDDCSPVWAAKVWTWTSFISLQGQCPWREGACHPALDSLQWSSQILQIPTQRRPGTLRKLSSCVRQCGNAEGRSVGNKGLRHHMVGCKRDRGSVLHSQRWRTEKSILGQGEWHEIGGQLRLINLLYGKIIE